MEAAGSKKHLGKQMYEMSKISIDIKVLNSDSKL